ncbi:DUF3800 domain-containing protein [Thermococcus sp. Bubb.Bath]|uniref:DUF3800 domain-containing protein n=1 Tax=Thermococcus sp. Bubb.Bath TaxID=1638242 RepID=UPI00143C68E4|nr:DUF3800 domain-containing protein [Thermococcus sp. Bubb.Bath]NJF25065.1 hypothetical protein [Thermococcus sp. Bubb.Bath]
MLFVDESGDLGGSRSRGRYFVLAGVLCEEKDIAPAIQSIIRERNVPELKFSRFPYSGELKVLRRLSSLDFEVVYVVLSKNSDALRAWLDRSGGNKSIAARVLYSELFRITGFSEAIVDRSHYSGDISRCLSRFGVEISAEDSYLRPGLQLADAIANVGYLHYQHKNEELFEVIRDKILAERFVTEKEILRRKLKSGG